MSNAKTTLKRFKFSFLFFVLYLTNVLVTKMQMLMGNTSPVHIGDVGEFLLLFATAITFVIAALQSEKASKIKDAHKS